MVVQIDIGNTMGITRHLDELNRIVMPMEIIKEQNLRSKKVAIYPLKDGVYIGFDKNKTEE